MNVTRDTTDIFRPWLMGIHIAVPLLNGLISFLGVCVVSCAVPVGNISWTFQEGRSSNFRLRQGVGQPAHTRNNPHVKGTGVY